jgi:hypothetical protein
MDNFNEPGSSKGIDDNFKKFAVEWQLDNVVRLLGGSLEHSNCYDYGDENAQYEKYVIKFNRKSRETD